MGIQRRKGTNELPPESYVERGQKEGGHAHNGQLGTYRCFQLHGCGDGAPLDRSMRRGMNSLS
jgi:hypothetical protein